VKLLWSEDLSNRDNRTPISYEMFPCRGKAGRCCDATSRMREYRSDSLDKDSLIPLSFIAEERVGSVVKRPYLDSGRTHLSFPA